MKRRTNSILKVLVCTILTSAGQVLIKTGVNAATTFWSYFNPAITIGLILYVGAAVLLITALKHADLSLVYPLIATSFIWVSLLSLYFLSEIIKPLTWAGIGFIVIGVGCIGRS